MSQPPGFINSQFPTHVCQHRKALCGLKQAPRAWYHELRSFLLFYGFTNVVFDPSLFIYHHNHQLIYFLVYVDDLVMTGSDPPSITRFIATISTKFSIKDLGSLHYFFGVEVLPTSSGLFLSQHKYIHDLLVRTRMDDAKEVGTPLPTTGSLVLNDGSPPANATEYRSVIGALQYLNLTRSDMSFTINKLSQFMHCLSESHWIATKRLLRYLKGTIFHGLHLRRHRNPSLHAFSDADWAGNLDDRTSTTTYVIFLGGNLISWSSRKQSLFHDLPQKLVSEP
jgi:hypothetical protein